MNPSNDKTTHNNTEVLLLALYKWAANHKKLVVAIDGSMGSGKTTLLEEVAKRNKDVLPVSGDDFIYPLPRRAELIANPPGDFSIAEHYFADFKTMRQLINAFKHSNNKTRVVRLPDDDVRHYDLSKSIMIVEGLFLFHPKLLNDQWDKRVYLEVDPYTVKDKSVKHEFETVYQQYQAQYKPQTLANCISSETYWTLS